MIPNSHEFDVFVSEGALVEVWRGEHVSVAQQFGVDWDGPSHSVMHSAVFTDPVTPPASGAPTQSREVSRVRRAGRWLRAVPWHVWLCLGYLIGFAASCGHR